MRPQYRGRAVAFIQSSWAVGWALSVLVYTIVFNLLLVLIIAFLMLIDGDKMWHRFTRVLSPELASEAELLRQSADRSFGG